ncbi:hypothetical protein ACFX12_046944 [Malus domestica]
MNKNKPTKSHKYAPINSVQPNTKKKVCTLRVLILNHSHHARDHHPASFKLLREAVFDEFYWEWLEDVLSQSKDVLTKVGLYHAVYASLFSYDRYHSVLRAFFEHWCSATNTLHCGIFTRGYVNFTVGSSQDRRLANSR